jgi:hypothetical protein
MCDTLGWRRRCGWGQEVVTVTDQATAFESDSDRNLWMAVAMIAIILVVLGVIGATTRRSRGQPAVAAGEPV